MNTTQALAKARKLLGPKAIIRVNERIPVGDERAAEIARRCVVMKQLRTALDACKARHEAILKADAEYQQLRTDIVDLESQRDRLASGVHSRVEILTNCGWYTRHEAGGDNLVDALNALVAKRARRDQT